MSETRLVEPELLLFESHASERWSGGELTGGELAALPLLLDEHERRALIRALYVVKDNWWLDPVEQELLQRLEAAGPHSEPSGV
jgi:hypothetical protein